MEAIGLMFLVAIAFIFAPAIIDHITFYVLSNRYKRLLKKKKEDPKN